jgi:DNA mismatch repair protein MutS
MTSKTTPLMEQYTRIRAGLPENTILFFRLGDFFEMFMDDACYAAEVLDIALTKRNKIPMCGVPCQNVQSYIAKLVESGRKVAVCDQVEEASASKGIVRREVTRIISSGTILEENALDARRNNYLSGLLRDGDSFGVATVDISTGEFWLEICRDEAETAGLLAKIAPAECVLPQELYESGIVERLLPFGSRTATTGYADWTFELEAASDFLLRHFKVQSFDGFGCGDCEAALGAAGGVLHYVSQELRRGIGHIRGLRVRRAEHFMLLDQTTVSNLELIPSGRAEDAQTNLLWVLDNTATAMGGRLLRNWLLRPLLELEQIVQRHAAVETLLDQRRVLSELRERLRGIKDLERIVARLASGGGSPRDVRALASSLEQIPVLQELLLPAEAALLRSSADQFDAERELLELIERALAEEPPATIKDGGMIRTGYSAELDELRAAASAGRQWLADFQNRERERTGIKNLKVRHNKVFGYYIEISKANIDKAPADYTRKQTLVNAERFITPELKVYENKILGAQERAVALEQEIFAELRAACVARTETIQRTAAALATVDVLANFADRAMHLRYVRPQMNTGETVRIAGGRHPVIEQIAESEPFVPNDTLLDRGGNQLLIITGPNMAGKSTYIRQVALIVIMAQIGSFIPATAAEIGVCDRVFTRVGASDDLARGRSTFMVEMQETANILNNATSRSLIVLDEIGRGTSTFDGISIAWAVAEYLHDTPAVKAKTLFATHYHELTELALTMAGVKNYHILVKESGQRIVFLRRIAPGAADKSYGIHVGQLAGLPQAVIERAGEILANLEEDEIGESGLPALAKHRPKKKRSDEKQLSLL